MNANEETKPMQGLYVDHVVTLEELKATAKAGGSYLIKAADALMLMERVLKAENRILELTATPTKE